MILSQKLFGNVIWLIFPDGVRGKGGVVGVTVSELVFRLDKLPGENVNVDTDD